MRIFYPFKNKQLCFALGFVFLMLSQIEGFSQKKRNTTPGTTVKFEEQYFNSLKWRCIGPFRGGRSAAVTGVAGQPNLYYFGATGGGVWRTTDAGASWKNISDGFFGGSIGAVAVSPSDNNVIYVGGGEKTVRGNVSHGYGMWKSLDAGKTWEEIGLKDSRHITRIKVHPNDPNLVYASVLGHLFGPNQERGVYRSKDGGETWERVLFVDENSGSVDLVLDPLNPRILYASIWQVKRTPYSLESGGKGSGLWKSTDGGDTWQNIAKESKGFPKGTLGIIGVTVSPVNNDRVWAIVEHKNGGVFRSEDGGKTWAKTNSERKLRQRAWYYTRIYADTKNPDMVYVLNVQFHRSKDGGKTFESIGTPHGDHHDLWISPENPNHMIIGDDGGGQVSLNGGESWSTYRNQPTAQFYRVVTDNHFPYRIYGGQQDNSTVRIASRTTGFGITDSDWESTAGGESAHIAPHPKNPDIVYGGSYGGFLTRVNHKTGERRAVNVYPDNPMGWAAKDIKYRFQWNFPILFSPHDDNTLYTAANVLFKTTNEGQSWEAISPDLTRNDTTKMASSGGPITKDNTSVEYYGTIFVVNESPLEKDVIWTGSDDGLVYVTQDGGKNWSNVTPKDMPEWMMVNSLDFHPTQKGTCYLAGTRYKMDDFQPYLYKTTDYGKTWTKITNGIPNDHFTRVLRVDPVKPDILYAGTESGMYISFNDGASWQPFMLNLPLVPITDLAIKENDLIAATQGRSFWILDDLTVLHQLSDQVKTAGVHLFKPRDTYNNMGGGRFRPGSTVGENPPGGVAIHFFMKDKLDTAQVASIEIMDSQDKLIRKFTTEKPKKGKSFEDKTIGKLKVKEGANLFVWNMRAPDAKDFKGMIMWAGGTRGPRVVPGTYKVKLSMGEQSQTQTFQILKDPRISASQADLVAQYNFLMEVREKLTETHEAIIQIREAKNQLNSFVKRIEGQENFKAIADTARSIQKKLGQVEKSLYQTKNRSRQDPLNFPIRLNNKLSALGSLASVGFNRPTQQMEDVRKEMTTLIDQELDKLRGIMQNEVPKFNQMVYQQNIPVIQVEKGAQ